MKSRAQTICALVFISIVIKSFFVSTNIVDAIILIAMAGIYCMYEFLTEQKTVIKMQLYKKETNARIETIQRDLDGTKNKVSTLNAGQALRR